MGWKFRFFLEIWFEITISDRGDFFFFLFFNDATAATRKKNK